MHFFPTAGDNFLGIAFEEDLADELGFTLLYGVGEMPGTIESLGEREVLLRNDSAGYSLV